MTRAGIDLSSHQGKVDWGKVTAEFVILRAGWSWYEGGMNIDKEFLANAQGAQQAGIPWGVYLYGYDRTPAAAEIAAERLAELLRRYQIPYPVAYDFEDEQYLTRSRTENTDICLAFLEAIRRQGYYPMLYTYTGFAISFLEMERLKDYDLWIADYTGKVGWNGPYGIWQYSGSGTAPGVSGKVDLDRAYRDYPAIIRKAGLNGYTAEEGGGDLQQENLLLRQQLAAAEGKLTEIGSILQRQ